MRGCKGSKYLVINQFYFHLFPSFPLLLLKDLSLLNTILFSNGLQMYTLLFNIQIFL